MRIANQWFLRAADQGNVDAQYKLAHNFRTGRGVEVNPGEAIRWYTRAADNGDVDAQHNLGIMYATGVGTSKDSTKAFSWFLKAAENGDPGAQYHVARRYRDADGTSQDLVSSYMWIMIMHSRTAGLAPEDLQNFLDLQSSVEHELSPEMKRVAEKRADHWSRSYTLRYLKKSWKLRGCD